MDSINITGAKIVFEIPIFGGIPITETQVKKMQEVMQPMFMEQ